MRYYDSMTGAEITLADVAKDDGLTDEEREEAQAAQDYEDTLDSLRYDFR